MYASRVLHAPVCASCRLRATIVAKQLARTRRPTTTFKPAWGRAALSTSRRLAQQDGRGIPLSDSGQNADLDEEAEREGIEYAKRLLADHPTPPPEDEAAEQEGAEYVKQLLAQSRALGQDISKSTAPQTPEAAALQAKRKYGEYLPEGELDAEAYKVYERLYGAPLRSAPDELEDGEDGGVQLMEEEGDGVALLREGKDGELEEVIMDELDEEDFEFEEGEDESAEISPADARLRADMELAMESGADVDLQTGT